MNRTAGPPRTRTIAFLIVTTLLAFALRMHHALLGGLTRDEGQAVDIAVLPDLASMFRFLVETESHPPLYYLLLRAWIAVFGTTDLALAVPSVALGALMVPVAWWAGRVLFDGRTATWAALIAAVFPILLFYSTLVRPYSLLPLLATLSFVALCRVVETRARGWAWTWGVAAGLLLLTHTWCVLLVAAEVLTGCVLVLRGDRRELRRVVLHAAAPVVLLWGPWLPFFLHQLTQGGHGLPPSSLAALPGEGLVAIVAALTSWGYGFPTDATAVARLPLEVGALLFVAWTSVLLVLITRAVRQRAEGGRIHASATLLAVAVATTAFAAALSPWSWLLVRHPFVMLSPVGILLIARGLTTVRKPRPAGILAAVCLAVVTLVAIVDARSRSNVRDVAAAVADAPADALVIVLPESYGNAMHRYLPPGRAVLYYPDKDPRAPLVYRDRWQRFAGAGPFELVLDSIRAAHAGGRPAWLITGHPNYAREIGPPPYEEGDFAIVVHRLQQIAAALSDLYGHDRVRRFGSGRAVFEELSIREFDGS